MKKKEMHELVKDRKTSSGENEKLTSVDKKCM